LLFDDGHIHRRLNTDRFLFLDPASDRSNILQAAEDPMKTGESSTISKAPSREGVIQDELEIWANGRDLFWNGLVQPLEVSVFNAQGRRVHRGRIESPSG
jgi:hypothetical protein